MRGACGFLLLLMMGGLLACTGGQERSSDLRPLLQGISADSIAAHVRTLTEMTAEPDTGGARDGQVARWIYARLNAYGEGEGGRLRVSYDRHPERGGRGDGRRGEVVNVIAVLPGIQMESRDRIYVVCSPYPLPPAREGTAEVSPAGTAVLLELARVMAGIELDATLVFLSLDGREGGGPAAESFARRVSRRNLDIDAVLSADLGGSGAYGAGEKLRFLAEGIPGGDRMEDDHRALLASGGENDTPSRNLARFLHRVAGNHIQGMETDMVYSGGMPRDRAPRHAFLGEGYPAVSLAGGDKGTGNTPGTAPAWLADVASLKAAALAKLADAPERPRRVRGEISGDGERLVLRWEANDEPDLEGYQVVWRSSISPYWEHETFAGDTTAFLIEGASPFLYHFGVRAVDRHGNASPAVFPLAGRPFDH